MKIIIVGGGIGGVATAITLLKEGHEVTLLEQAPQLSEVGGGLVVGPNAKKALNYLGAGEHAAATGVATEETIFYDMESGEKMFATTLGDTGAKAHGDYQYTMHRADLLDSLVRQLPMEHVRLNSRVESIEESADSVTVTIENGDTFSAELLVGADGIRSRVRAQFFDESDPQFTGLLGWRALIPADKLPKEESLPLVRAWFGKGRHVGVYPVRPNKLINLFAWVPADEVVRESWSLSGDVADLRKALNMACPDLKVVVDEIQDAFITPLYIRDPTPKWCTDRIALLGDAAHPATAAAGQGAAMALEDAVTFGICMRGVSNDAELKVGLHEYHQRRLGRTSRMQAISKGNLKWMNESDPVQRKARNGRFAGLSQLDPLGLGMWRWFFTHDVVKSAETPLAEALKAVGQPPNDRKRPEAKAAFDAWCTAIKPQHRANLWEGERIGYDEFLNRVEPAPEEAEIKSVDADGVASLLVGDGDGPIVFYVHGGGFTLGSAKASTGLAARIAASLNGRAFVPDYRLAPEHAAPAGLQDVITSYKWLLNQSWCPSEIHILGEEVGANLALSLCIKTAKDSAKSIHVVSPFLDLTVSAPSIEGSAGRDPWSARERLMMSSAAYIQNINPRSPAISAQLSDLAGLPPLRVYAASDEALADDARSLAEQAKSAGVQVTLTEIEDSVPCFVLFPALAESQIVIDGIASMISEGSK